METGSIEQRTGLPDPRTTLDYNGWRYAPDSQNFIEWNHINYQDLADFQSTGHGVHSLLIDYDTFINALPPVKGATYFPDDVNLQLDPLTAQVIDAGEPLNNFTDNAPGLPDMGAYESGQPIPHFGPRSNLGPIITEEASAHPQVLNLPQKCD